MTRCAAGFSGRHSGRKRGSLACFFFKPEFVSQRHGTRRTVSPCTQPCARRTRYIYIKKTREKGEGGYTAVEVDILLYLDPFGKKKKNTEEIRAFTEQFMNRQDRRGKFPHVQGDNFGPKHASSPIKGWTKALTCPRFSVVIAAVDDHDDRLVIHLLSSPS